MICPSCGNVSTPNDKHCSRCGLSLTIKSQRVFSAIGTFSWIMRRALGGMFAGIIGWMISQLLIQMGSSSSIPVNLVVGCAVGGAFLGTVGGIIERSSYKAFLGGALGCIGGILGGLMNRPVYDMFINHTYVVSISHSFSWAMVGLFVGMSSGLIERNIKKVSVGLLAGIIGGALGGFLGFEVYAALLIDPDRFTWLTARVIDAIAGAVVGINLWFFIGLVEKLYIFNRKQLLQETVKTCDFCQTQNSLKSWYCKNCGKALQVSAPIEKLAITPYRSLERISNAFKFLSWLSAVAGIVLVVIIFVFLLFKDIRLAIFLSIALAILIYIISIILNSLSEIIVKFTKIKETD